MLYVLQCEREKPHAGHYGKTKSHKIREENPFPFLRISKTMQTPPPVCACVCVCPPAGPGGGDQPLLRLVVHLLAVPVSFRATRRTTHTVLLFYAHPDPNASSAGDHRHRQRGGQQRSDRVAETESGLQHGSPRVRSRESDASFGCLGAARSPGSCLYLF